MGVLATHTSGFSTEVRDVQLAANPVTIPAVPVEIGVDVIHPGELVDFAACPADPADRRPDFIGSLRPLNQVLSVVSS